MAVFAAALLESFALFGIFFPGSTLVFVGDVLIGLSVLDSYPPYLNQSASES